MKDQPEVAANDLIKKWPKIKDQAEVAANDILLSSSLEDTWTT